MKLLEKILDWLLLLFLIGTTGFEFFYRSEVYIIILFLLSSTVFFIRKKAFDSGFFIIIAFILIIQILQGLKFSYWPINTFIGMHVRVFSAYFVIKSLGKGFIDKYIRFIRFFAIVSLFVFIPLSFFDSLSDFFISTISPYFKNPLAEGTDMYKSSANIIVYNLGVSFKAYLYPRNSGPFWEPGAFAGFLIIAIIFELIRNKNFYSKTNLIFVITLITTFSTTGYVVLFLLLMINYTNKISVFNIISFVVLSLIVGTLYFNVPFLKNKIDESILVTNSNTKHNLTITRFQSALFDLQDLQNSYIVGLGRNAKTRYGSYATSDIYLTHRNNGVTNLLVTYGIPFFVLYWILYFNAIRRISLYNEFTKIKPGLLLLMFIIIGLSESYYLRPLFFSFGLLPFVFPNKPILLKNNSIKS